MPRKNLRLGMSVWFIDKENNQRIGKIIHIEKDLLIVSWIHWQEGRKTTNVAPSHCQPA